MENSGKQERLNALFLKMIAFDEGDPKRIQHFVKVHSFAKLIGELEKAFGLQRKSSEETTGSFRNGKGRSRPES